MDGTSPLRYVVRIVLLVQKKLYRGRPTCTVSSRRNSCTMFFPRCLQGRFAKSLHGKIYCKNCKQSAQKMCVWGPLYDDAYRGIIPTTRCKWRPAALATPHTVATVYSVLRLRHAGC